MKTLKYQWDLLYGMRFKGTRDSINCLNIQEMKHYLQGHNKDKGIQL